MNPVDQGTSTRPYLIRALHDWCTDNGFTPYIAVHVDETVEVPLEYVKNNEIVLNVGFEATSALDLGNEFISFKARFGGVARDISVPVDHVIAIYARENGQGMAFPMPTQEGAGPSMGTDRVDERPAASKEGTGGRSRSGPRLAAVSDEAAPAGFSASGDADGASDDTHDGPEPPHGGGDGGRPALKRIK